MIEGKLSKNTYYQSFPILFLNIRQFSYHKQYRPQSKIWYVEELTLIDFSFLDYILCS